MRWEMPLHVWNRPDLVTYPGYAGKPWTSPPTVGPAPPWLNPPLWTAWEIPVERVPMIADTRNRITFGYLPYDDQ